MSCPIYAGFCGSGDDTTYYCCPSGYVLACKTPAPTDCPIIDGAIKCPCDPNYVEYTQCHRQGNPNDIAEIRGCIETENEKNEGSTKYTNLVFGDICPCGPTVEKNGHCGYNNNPKKLHFEH